MQNFYKKSATGLCPTVLSDITSLSFAAGAVIVRGAAIDLNKNLD